MENIVWIMKQMYTCGYNDGCAGCDQWHYVAPDLATALYQDGYNAGCNDRLIGETAYKMDDETWTRICEELKNGPQCPESILATYMNIMSEYVALRSDACVPENPRPAKMARYE